MHPTPKKEEAEPVLTVEMHYYCQARETNSDGHVGDGMRTAGRGNVLRENNARPYVGSATWGSEARWSSLLIFSLRACASFLQRSTVACKCNVHLVLVLHVIEMIRSSC
jgi:hypothetical protein